MILRATVILNKLLKTEFTTTENHGDASRSHSVRSLEVILMAYSYQVILLCMPSAYMDIPKSKEVALKDPIRIFIRPRNKSVFPSA